VNADGSGASTRLDRFSTEVADPEWSPDGTRIAFTGRESLDFSGESVHFYLFVINADGSGQTRIADWPLPFNSFFFQEGGSGPTWSPDGTQIAYSYDNGQSPTQQPRRVADIAVVNASGGAVKFLTEHPAADTFPSWSPDGARIAFTSNRDGRRAIYVMNSDGSQPLRLTSTVADNFDPNWQTLGASATLQPARSTVQFRASVFRVRERAITDHTEDLLTITRLGDLSHEASVDFTTSSSCIGSSDPTCTTTASERSDYITASGTLRFAPGEAARTINVAIVDDAYVEGNESFNVLLSNPTGCALGGQQTATVIITDNDTSPASSNPIDEKAFFVHQHYLDFLNREPDPPGFTGWQNILGNCAQDDTRCDRTEVSSGFFRSTEFQVRGYFVFRFYSVALGRKPDYAEFMPDLRRVTGFITDDQLEANKVAFINDFMARPAFRSKYDQLTGASDYVNTLLATAGVNLPNREGLISDLAAGRKTRAEVLREIAESTEVYQKFYNRAFVVMQYFGYLRRDPDSLYLDWIKTMNQTGDYRTMINGFMNSIEYRRRFGP
jgi:hypothetical protein